MKKLLLCLIALGLLIAASFQAFAWWNVGVVGGQTPAATGCTPGAIGTTSETGGNAKPPVAAGDIILWRFQASVTGTGCQLSSISAYLYGNANWIGVVYSDSSGEPYKLIDYTASNSGPGFSFAWDNNVAVTNAVSVSNSAYYWVGIQVSSAIDFQIRTLQTGAPCRYLAGSFGSPPATWDTETDVDPIASWDGGIIYVSFE